jgi:urease accessory protein
MNHKTLFLLTPALLIAPLTLAHTGAHTTNSFTTGFLHPLTGVDHLLAMLAIGLLAGQRGGKSLYALPLTFLTAIILGGLLALGALSLPLLEPTLTTSVLILGVCVALGTAVPPSTLLIFPALFAVCHGYAHVAEMPPGASLITYATGFLLSTTILLSAGILFGATTRRFLPTIVARLTGAGIATCGVLLFAHVL